MEATPDPAKSTKLESKPLPATIDIQGYEITIPNVKNCWRVNIKHSCGHPKMDDVSMYDDIPLVVEVNRHMRPCAAKCKVESLDYILRDSCGDCP